MYSELKSNEFEDIFFTYVGELATGTYNRQPQYERKCPNLWLSAVIVTIITVSQQFIFYFRT